MNILYLQWSKQTINIRKTCPCNVYPLETHFYIEKLGYAGVHLFFLILLQNIDCGYSLEPPRRVPTIYVLEQNKKNIKIFLVKNFIFSANFFFLNIAWTSFCNEIFWEHGCVCLISEHEWLLKMLLSFGPLESHEITVSCQQEKNDQK